MTKNSAFSISFELSAPWLLGYRRIAGKSMQNSSFFLVRSIRPPTRASPQHGGGRVLARTQWLPDHTDYETTILSASPQSHWPLDCFRLFHACDALWFFRTGSERVRLSSIGIFYLSSLRAPPCSSANERRPPWVAVARLATRVLRACSAWRRLSGALLLRRTARSPQTSSGYQAHLDPQLWDCIRSLWSQSDTLSSSCAIWSPVLCFNEKTIAGQ